MAGWLITWDGFGGGGEWVSVSKDNAMDAAAREALEWWG